MNFSTTVSLLASLGFFFNLSAQSSLNNVDSIGNIFKALVDNSKKEKIILETDKKIYLAGEKIWFNAFVVNAVNGEIDLASKNLFTDLVDDRDHVISKLVLNNSRPKTRGAITLPDSLISGFYWLRSYTEKMLSEDSESIFLRPVYVVNRQLRDTVNYYKRSAITLKNGSHTSPVIHFFSERLTGIPGISSTGVLKVADANSNPVSVPGDIRDSNDSVISSFKTNHLGLAAVSFLDDPNRSYTAVIHFNGEDIRYPLPSIDHYAAQLSVINRSDASIGAFVSLEDSLPTNYRTIVLGVTRDSLCFAAIGTGSYNINIPLNNFPGGIASLLLFDEHRHLCAERKIYIKKNNYRVDIKTNKKNYTARDEAKLNIKVTDSKGNPLTAALNISIQNEAITNFSDSIEADNIPYSNEFLMNNWLTIHDDKFSSADLDLLMMTVQSLYNSKNIDNGTKKAYDDSNEKLLNLMGKITDKKNQPLKNRVVTVFSRNETGLFADIDTTNDSGRFKIPLPQNMDTIALSLQVTDKHGIPENDDKILIDTFNFPDFTTPSSLKHAFFPYNKDTLRSIRKNFDDPEFILRNRGSLPLVKVTAVKKKEPTYDVSKRINSISRILTSEKFRNGGSNAISNAILTVPGVSLIGDDISMWGSLHPPVVIMDGFEVPIKAVYGGSVVNFLNSLQPANIEFIEVLRGGEAAIYGSRGGNGAIVVNSRNGPPVLPDEKNHLTVFTPLTYHVCPRFFMPDYSNRDTRNSKTPDARTTIYWNGAITTNSEGQASASFFTADDASNYCVTVTGLTVRGDIVYKRIFISRN